VSEVVGDLDLAIPRPPTIPDGPAKPQARSASKWASTRPTVSGAHSLALGACGRDSNSLVVRQFLTVFLDMYEGAGFSW